MIVAIIPPILVFGSAYYTYRKWLKENEN